jgi:eukaryotic-like serine/threonine-protein kinase
MTKPAPSPSLDRNRFRDIALASGLLDEAQIAAAEREIAVIVDPKTSKPDAWDRAVSDRLVAQGLLTPFQARELLVGRRRFRLGQYTVLDEIAKGGMGQVFRAEHAMMGREVAMKVLPRAKSTPESEAAFRREMRMLGRLDHENLVRAYDAGYDAMVYYLVTELVPGMDLKRHVQTHGPLGEAEAASIIAQAARGLSYAHEQGLVHRDVKPGNILVMQDGRVKVLDLGLAGSQLEEESSRVGHVIGTMDYIAPEQIRMPDDVGPSADVYALGCTLYYAVTGRVPFPGGTRKEKMHRHLHETPDPVRKLAPHLGEAFCQVIEAMMAKVPEDRLRSANDVVERLRPWLPEPQGNGSRIAAMPAATVSRPRDTGRPPPLPAIVGGPPILEPSASGSGGDAGVDHGPPEVGSPGLGLFAFLPTPDRLAAAITSFRRRWLSRLVLQALVVALPAGVAFALAMALVRSIDAARFNDLLRGMTPVSLGWGAFLVLFALQMLAGVSGRTRR